MILNRQSPAYALFTRRRILPQPAQPALLHLKSNLGRLAPPLGYKIDERGVFAWTGPVRITPEELLSTRAPVAAQPQRRFAGEWLRQQLQSGSRSQYIDRDGRATRWHLHRSSGFRNWCRPKPRIFSWFSPKENHSSPPL